METTTRETVTIDGRYVESVRWAPGAGWRTTSVRLTSDRSKAATFVPAAAAAIRKAYWPEAVARHRAAEAAAVAILGAAFADAVKNIDPELAAYARRVTRF
jgi:hypothetical protein